MKQGIHPTVYPTIIVDTSCDEELTTFSTLETGETRDIDGVTYQVQRVEISSASHPFFTGKSTLVDTAGRVDRFKAKQERHASVDDKLKGRSKREKRKQKDNKSGAKSNAKAALKAAKAALADN